VRCRHDDCSGRNACLFGCPLSYNSGKIRPDSDQIADNQRCLGVTITEDCGTCQKRIGGTFAESLMEVAGHREWLRRRNVLLSKARLEFHWY